MNDVISLPHRLLIVSLSVLFVLACGDAGERSFSGDEGMNHDGPTENNPSNGAQGPGDPTNPFVPEEEEFLVREVASTDHHVFVPNSDPESHTVALIDGRDYSVLPVRVGRQPTQVVATQHPELGSVAYVLCEGSSVIAIIRADMMSGLDRSHVNILPIPRELNAITMAPDGESLIAYIDPSRPIDESASVASLQTMALIRLGETPDKDRAFELSITRLISTIAFTEDGRTAFIVGAEGVNRIALHAIDRDAFIAPIRLELSDELFPPSDQEVLVAKDGSFMVVRTSQFAGVATIELDEHGVILDRRLIELDGIPTDINLVEKENERKIVATVRDHDQVVIVDLDVLFASDEETDSADYLTTLVIEGAQAGLARQTPDDERLLLYTTQIKTPLLGIYRWSDQVIETFILRNQIRSLAISKDSRTAVIVHRKQPGNAGDPTDSLEQFQHSHGLTIVDLDTGYRRPIILQGEPTDILMTQSEGGQSVVYAMLNSPSPNDQGVARIDMGSFRTDFIRLPRPPVQLGIAAGKVFVNQEASTGRITFFDIETQAQRTVSGYELNAGID
ncbi:MAG: hypothetical protein ACNA8W_01310 [Bradymonadaceae bacterium]